MNYGTASNYSGPSYSAQMARILKGDTAGNKDMAKKELLRLSALGDKEAEELYRTTMDSLTPGSKTRKQSRRRFQEIMSSNYPEQYQFLNKRPNPRDAYAGMVQSAFDRMT